MTLPCISPAQRQKGSPALCLCLCLVLGACRTAAPDPGLDRKMALFSKVRPVLENSCVHCHAAQRLLGMPSFSNTKALAALTGTGKLIVPGAPELSRFFQVVTLSGHDAGAMPPTGHDLPRLSAEALRTWILEGAPVPEQNMELTPQGAVPRSR